LLRRKWTIWCNERWPRCACICKTFHSQGMKHL
jgi:hypothetical protein